MPIIDFLLPEYDQEMANTRKMLAAIPDDRLDFQRHAKSFTMKNLAIHLATIPEWTADTIEKSQLDFAPEGQPGYKPPDLKSQKELLGTFDSGVAKGRAALAGASDEALMQPWSLLQTGKVLFTMPRIAVIRSFVMNHAIHHRAQLGVYLRLVDQPVPGMYGPSADDPGF
jgi:uncharacterized damage-inducible protein DinB